MASIHVEGETFETLFVPLNEQEKPGVDLSLSFYEVPDALEEKLSKREEELWKLKLTEAKVKGINLTNGNQYGFIPTVFSYTLIMNRNLVLQLSKTRYSRIELAKEENSKNISNVLALSEIIEGSDGYLFVQRGNKVAYYNNSGQLHALVAGNYPQNIDFLSPNNMSIDKWLTEQQKTEHCIDKTEITDRLFLGVVLDKKCGYKPDIVYTAKTPLNKQELSKRNAIDAWEKKGVIETPSTEKELRTLILEHSELKQHVPPGYAGAILELAKAFGLQALDRLNYEGKKGSAPLIEYSVIR